jgi:hypothetical protein
MTQKLDRSHARVQMKDIPYGIIELVFVFGIILAFLFWELFSLRRYRRDKGELPPRKTDR